MPRLRIPYHFASAWFLVFLVINPAWGQSFNSVLSKLDQTYYYPQKQGLKSFSARIEWDQLDVASGSGKFLRNPDFIFSWQADSFSKQGSLANAHSHYRGASSPALASLHSER